MMTSQQRFTFVNVSAPNDTKTHRRRIRSAAAASGWAQGGRPTQKPRSDDASYSAGPKTTSSDESVSPKTSHSGRQQASKHPITAITDLKRVSTGASTLEATTRATNPSLQETPRDSVWEGNHSRKRPLLESHETPATVVSGPSEPTTSSSLLHSEAANTKKKRTKRSKRSASSVTKFSIPTSAGVVSTFQPPKPSSPLSLGSGSGDVFNCYPVTHDQPWFDRQTVDRVLHHMLTVFAPRGWPSLGITNTEGMNWERFMTQHALAEPALFNVRLLFASGDLIRMNILKPEVSFWLRSQAVKSINEALADSERATSIPLILAVGRIALHESMYGDRSAANLVHRPAQHRMITMRGGMAALDIPELVKRLMRWSDRVMSMQSDTPRFLPDDDRSFSLGQSVDVLEQWVPQQGWSLRQKVSRQRQYMAQPPSDS